MELLILLITLGGLLIVGLAIDEFGRHWYPRPAWRWWRWNSFRKWGLRFSP